MLLSRAGLLQSGVSLPSTLPTGGLTMQCPRCQAENRAGRRFCAECGAPLALPCSACGFSNEPEEKFCGGCGTPLTAAPPPPEPPGRAPPTHTPGHPAGKDLPAQNAL